MAAKEKQAPDYLNTEAQGIAKIAQAINRVQQAISHVPKDSKAGTMYNYVSEVKLVEAIHDLVVAEGLILSPAIELGHDATVTQIESKTGAKGIDVIWKQSFMLIHAPSGQVWPEWITVMAEGADYGDKAVWKGLTAAHKYAWLRLLNIATAQDPEADRSMDGGYGKRGKQAKPENESTGKDTSDPGEMHRWISQVGEDYELSRDDMQRWGVWVTAFRGVEDFYGKENMTDDNKWNCYKAFGKIHGLHPNNKFKAKHIVPFREFAATTFQDDTPNNQENESQ